MDNTTLGSKLALSHMLTFDAKEQSTVILTKYFRIGLRDNHANILMKLYLLSCVWRIEYYFSEQSFLLTLSL